jgi:hypothetical protein
LPPADGQEGPKPDAAAAKADEKDTRLTPEDIRQLRRKRVSPEDIADEVAERGRAFEVTADATRKLRSLGFRPAQVDAIKDASDEPLLPGKWLTASDSQRDETYKEIELVAAKSGAAIKPIQSQHVTLWAAKDVQQMYLPDIKKLEKFFHTKCVEPIRSGLDKRSTHVVLLKDHAEYEAWARTYFKRNPREFEQKDNPGAAEEFRSRILKRSIFNWRQFSAISRRDLGSYWVRRFLAAQVGGMYYAQLAQDNGPLEMGFSDVAEAVVTGWPSVTYCDVGYHEDARNVGNDRRAWLVLVQQRMASNQATPLGKLLKMTSYNMLQPHYAEGWSLVDFLSKRPGKFGKMMLAQRERCSELEAIEKAYGWDEKTLTKKWRAYVVGQTAKGAAGRP